SRNETLKLLAFYKFSVTEQMDALLSRFEDYFCLLICPHPSLVTIYRNLAIKHSCRFLNLCDLGIDYASDGIHFSVKGHAQMAKIVLKFVSE
ncbi:MAG: hypothetical protein Q4C49_08440, partial [Bacillota bacterium]|nr:hypothetical protein [Bacillota bacterium]